jgi:hypothetical protein
METLKRFKVWPYLVRLIRYSYLNDRWIAYTGRNREEKRPVEYGVPQGSVLGPILWITAYDSVLRCPMPPGTDMVCLVGIRHLSPGRGSRMVRDIEARGDRRGMRNARRPETGPERVADQVRGFFDHRTRGAPPPELCVDEEEVPVRSQMRYLGLTIDNRWTFGPHFDLLVPKVTATANALCGLLPNIGGGRTAPRTTDSSGHSF